MEKFMAMRAKFPVAVNEKNKPVYISVFFRDSFQLLNSGLAELVKNVGSDSLIETFKMKQIYDVSENVIKAKGIFPYSFFDKFSKIDYPQLPCFDAFYNDLHNRNISVADYEMARKA